MIALLTVLCFFFVTVDGQVEVCTLADEYKSLYQDFHQYIRQLIWRDGVDQHAKLEILDPASKTGVESPYIKIEGQGEFPKSDSRPLTKKVSDVLKTFIKRLAKQVKKFQYGTQYGCNAVFDRSGEESDKLKVVCLYRPLSTGPSVTTSPPSPKPTPTATSPQSDEVDFDNSMQPEERLGSLLKLPKPKKSPVEGEAVPRGVGPQAVASPAVGNTSITPGSIEDEVPFCKSYSSACASTNGIIPVLTYCQRGPKVEQELLQFCFAFEQFCLPELTPAQPVQRPQSSLRRCEDVLPEARKVCNPFPPPRDTFNVLRCSNFLTNCKKFVDWA